MYEWDGNRNIGKGRAEITDTSPASSMERMVGGQFEEGLANLKTIAAK